MEAITAVERNSGLRTLSCNIPYFAERTPLARECDDLRPLRGACRMQLLTDAAARQRKPASFESNPTPVAANQARNRDGRGGPDDRARGSALTSVVRGLKDNLFHRSGRKGR